MDVAKPIIELRRLSKSFGAHRVLDDIDLRVERGKATIIIGRSGSGKSVLLKHIVGLLQPDRGEVYFDGTRTDVLSERALTPIRRQISFVFQLNALFDSMTVLENVSFPMKETAAKRVPRAEIRKLAEHALELVGMLGSEGKRPAELSGGEKKRVALARAIALDPPPKVIMYDEPTTGLDPPRADVINKLIRHLQQQLGVTSLVVTHDMHSAAEVGDRILMLRHGRFVADGTAKMLAESTDEHVRRFVEGVAEPEDLRTLSGISASRV